MSAKGLNEFSVLNFQHSSPHQGGSSFVIRLIMNLDERKGKKTFTKLGLLRIKNLNQKLGIYWRLRFKIMWLKNVFKTTGKVTLRLENLVIYIIILFVSDFIYQGTTTFSKSLWNNLWMPHQNLHGVTRSSIYGMMKGSGAGFRLDWRICSVV